MSGLYDTDIALWAEQQAKLLRRRASHELDWQNIAEEIEDVGKASNARSRAVSLCSSPSLQNRPASLLAETYADGRRVAEAETGLQKLPAQCPWPVEQMLDHDFWPES